MGSGNNSRVLPLPEQESLTRMELANGSRIISLPGSEKTVRGYSAATLIIMDEAARIPDELLASVTPMLATTDGRLIALSTPAGKRGWFYEIWQTMATTPAPYQGRGHRLRWISPEFLAAELKLLGPQRYSEEYCLQFVDNAEAVFLTSIIQAAFTSEVTPLWA